MINYPRFLFVFLFIFPCFLFADGQFLPETNYPRGYFAWPVDAKIGIVANFGELRPNHYHMGLDCRTDQHENKRVLAAADGYVAKVKIEPSGFGRCIYINHPNGLTTLYAHLNNFAPALEAYVTAQQYKLKQWAVFLDIPPTVFPVSKGDFIAYSGSTGGSQGPHVHFEIRETATDKVLNPLLFGMPIPDAIAPEIHRLAIYDRRKSTYEQTPRYIPLHKSNGVYTVPGGKLKVNSNEVSFAITAFDRYTGSTNQNGIYETIVRENDKPVSGFQLNRISYDETRYLNAHIDYPLRSRGGPYLQHLSRLPGYVNGIYPETPTDGVISLSPGEEKNIRITVSDPAKNTSTVSFTITADDEIAPVSTPAGTLFRPNMVNVFDNGQVFFYLPENALYDSFHFRFNVLSSAVGRPIYQLQDANIPLHTYVNFSLRDNFAMEDTGKIVMKRSFGSKDDYRKATYANGWYTAAFREFGNFQLMVDREPPRVNGSVPSRVTAGRRIVFGVSDNTEVISSFTALLDGNWIRFTNDKGRNFIYTVDDHFPPGDHTFVITAIDQVGNTTTRTFSVSR